MASVFSLSPGSLIPEGTMVHHIGLQTFARWLCAVAALYLFAASGSSIVFFEQEEESGSGWSDTRIMSAATAVAFASVCILMLSAYAHAQTTEKRCLAEIMLFVNVIAMCSHVLGALLPMPVARDPMTGHSIHLLRSVEWCFTCPNILQWFAVVVQADQGVHMYFYVRMLLVIGLGVAGDMTQGTLSGMLATASGLLFVSILEQMARAASKALEEKPKMLALPAKAIPICKWQVAVTWSLFAVINWSARLFLIEERTVFALYCVADLAAKAGLVTVLVNINFEQMSVAHAVQLRSAITGILHYTHDDSHVKDSLSHLDSEVREWLLEEYTNHRWRSQHIPRSKKPSHASSSMASPSHHTTLRRSSRASRHWQADAAAMQIVHDWDYEAIGRSDDELLQHCFLMFQDMGVLETLEINVTAFRAFLIRIREQYHSNPYHNFEHAVCVLQNAYKLCMEAMSEVSSDVELLATLTAALCHDVDHRGLNNYYHINSQSPLALLYNDHSVLESHHCSVAFKTLREPKCNFIRKLETEKQTLFRTVVIKCILGTDMAEHNVAADRLVTIFEQQEMCDIATSDTLRHFMFQCIVHTADLYNVIKSFESNVLWAKRLHKEFDLQVALEEKLALPSLSFMKAHGDLAIARGEVGFFEFVVLPWYKAFTSVMPALDHLRLRAEGNLARWKEEASRLAQDDLAHL